MWTSEEPYDFYRTSHPWTNVAKAGAGIAGLTALGFVPTRNGKRVWDFYATLARGIEEYSPGHILRTFQTSTILSQFEKATQEAFFRPELLASNKQLGFYFAELINKPADVGRLATEGVSLRGGKLFWGTGTEVALEHARGIRAPPGAASWVGQGWSFALGLSNRKNSNWPYFWTSEYPKFGNPDIRNLVDEDKFVTQIVGGQTRRQVAGRWWSAFSTEMMGRFNRLLEAPAGFPVLENIFTKTRDFARKRLGIQHLGFGVREGTGSQMLMRFMGKYGVALPLAALGYKTLDWAMDDSAITSGTIFEEGLTTGIGTVGIKTNLAISRLAELTGGHALREKQEEIAPGSTSLAKLAAFPLLGGLAASGGLYAIKAGKMAHMQITQGVTASAAREAIEESMQHFGEGKGWISKAARYLTLEKGGLYEAEGFFGKVWRKIAAPGIDTALKAVDHLNPAKFGGSKPLKFKLLNQMTPARLAGTLGILAGTALALPFLPGALVPSERPEELEDIYSGRKEIAVRGGRWWEFGRSAWEGNKISYFRPHWYARMRIDAREKGIWGDEADTLSPLEKIWKQEFTYDLERKHYYDRPYPVTSLPFEDVPILGPLLANTFGRLIKPPQLMHTEEWLGEGGGQLVQPPRFEERIATEIGQKLPGKATTPFDLSGAAGEQIYRFGEVVGLPGFMASSIKEQLTGTGDWFDQVSRLENARRMSGFERQYWDLELGGLLGTTEAFRRLYPHRRRQIPLYNPIRNTMPEWLPGPGEKSPDFRHGDPYTKVPEGELRLPGAGYEARYPELKGITPDDYPLIHRYRILGDVAPYSTQFDETNRIVQAARNTPNWTEEEENIYQNVKEQLQARKQKKIFDEYQYLSPMGEIFGRRQEAYGSAGSSELIATLNQAKAETREENEKGVLSKLFGGYWELLSHNAEASLEQLTPISPGAKLVHQRTAIEDYQRTQVYGTENAFWNHPIRDFFRPSAWLAAQSLGFEGIPTHIEKKRNLEEYFDILKYTKAARLANIARLSGDIDSAREYENQKDKTLFGINPYTRNFSSIFNALPRNERDYFNAFVAAGTPEERQEILSTVPDNEKSLYIARWKLAFGDEVQKAARQGKLNDKALGEAEKILIKVGEDAAAEGMPTSSELQQQYLTERAGGEGYADWYRRRYLLTSVESLPGPDWVGWHPSVDLDDIKLKVVQTIGEDMHSYDLWQAQAQQLEQKPYINEEAVAPILDPESLSRGEMHARINELLMVNKIKGSTFSRSSFGGRPGTKVDVTIEHQNDQDDLLKRILGNGR